jgi:hypothetical protein
MLHAGVIGGGDLEGGVPDICPFAAATTVCEPLTSPADRLSSGPLHMRAMSLSTRSSTEPNGSLHSTVI